MNHTYHVYVRIKHPNGSYENASVNDSPDNLTLDSAEIWARIFSKRLLETWCGQLAHYHRSSALPDADLPDRVRGRLVLDDRRILSVRMRVSTPVIWSLAQGASALERNAGIVPLYDLRNKAMQVLANAPGVTAGSPTHWHGLPMTWTGPIWEIAGRGDFTVRAHAPY